MIERTADPRAEFVAAIEERLGRPLTAQDWNSSLSELGFDSMTVAGFASFARGPIQDLGAERSLRSLAETLDAAGAPEPPGRVRYERSLDAFPEVRRFATESDERARAVFSRVVGSRSRGRARVDGREVLDFASYDYLGLARHPDVIAAARVALDEHGASASASRIAGGERPIHRDLEAGLARFVGHESALVFPAGHAAAVSVIGHLLGPNDLILLDESAHNCAWQGARLSGARRFRFRHNDLDDARGVLETERDRHARALIVVEGLYSADGDVPDLRGLLDLRDRFDALLFVDEAHSIGTVGATGRGICESSGVDPSSVDLLFGTLSKALGGCGGFVASRRDLVEYLRFTCPGYVFSAAMPPVNAAAARAALTVLQNEPSRPARVAGLARRFLEACRSRGLDTGRSGGFPVATVCAGNTATALDAAVRLFEDGLLVSPMIAPAVPEGEARLRFFLSVHHDEADVDRAAEAVARAVAPALSN